MPVKKNKARPMKGQSMARGMLKEIDVVVKPGAPLGAVFEYRNRALIVKSFTPQSALPGEGVVVGMALSHVENEAVIGYDQPAITNLLTRNAHELKMVKFTGLPKFEPKDDSVERGKMEAKYGLDALAAARADRGITGIAPKQNQDTDDDWRKALEVKPASKASFSTSKCAPAVPSSKQLPHNDLASLVSNQAQNPTKKSNQSSSDPFSTPARRRRIIADVSKFLLKQYCQKACKNVALWRKQTAASLVIQRAWRGKYARLLVARLRLRKWSAAALTIQMMTRMCLARAELRRRRKALLLKRATYLAVLLQNAWKERKMRIQAAKLRAERLARLMRRKAKVAIEIQRVFRGMLGRGIAMALRLRNNKFAQLRHRCAIIIQSVTRRHAAYQLRVSLLRARFRIGQSVLMYHRRINLRRRLNCRVIQRVARGYLVRKLASRLRHERELARLRLLAEKEKRRLEALFQQQVEEARQMEEDAATKRADIRVTLSMMLLQHMAALGPAEVVRWALQNSIIMFSEDRGYDLGSVLKQVFASVLAAYPDIEARPSSRERPRSREAGLVDDSREEEGEKCVKVRSWDVSESTTPPPKEFYPNSWGQVAFWRGMIQKESNTSVESVGAAVKVERDNSALRVVLTKTLQPERRATVSVSVTSPVTQLNTAEVVFQMKTEIAIVLEGEIDAETGLPTVITPASGVVINPTGFRTAGASASLELDNDFKFKFKDAIVTIEPPQPVSPVKERRVDNEPVKDDEDSQDGGGEVVNDSFDDSFEEEVAPTVVKVQFIEPDLNPQAGIIQRAYRMHYNNRLSAARRITGWLKTMRVLEVWWDLVDEVLELATENAIIMQKYVRRLLGDRKVARRRKQAIHRLSTLCMKNSTFFLDDMGSHRGFLDSEANNWKRFGMEPDPSVPFITLEPTITTTQEQGKQVQVQARTIDTCGVLVSSDAGKKHDRSGDAGATIARFVCLHLITSDGLMSSVHPMRHLAASACVLTPEPWDVFDENDLAINTSKESANGTSGDDESAIPPRAVPTLHTTLAGTRIFE